MFLYISSIRAIDFKIVLCQQLLTTNTKGGLSVRTPGIHGKNVASETYNFRSGCQRLSRRVLFRRQCWRKVHCWKEIRRPRTSSVGTRRK